MIGTHSIITFVVALVVAFAATVKIRTHALSPLVGTLIFGVVVFGAASIGFI